MANREEKTRALINYVLEYAVDKGYSLKDLELFEMEFRREMYSLESLLKELPLIAQDVLATHVSDLHRCKHHVFERKIRE